MIVAVVTFLAAGLPPSRIASRERFATMAACAAFIASEEPTLHSIAERVGAQLGRPVTFSATCVNMGPAT